MSSSYVGVAATATDTLELMTGGDTPTAQLFRVPLERLLDNDAARRAASVAADLESNALRFVPLALPAGDTITDASAFMAAAQEDPTDPLGKILLIKSDDNDTFGLYSGAPYAQSTGADIDSNGGITSAVREAAGGAGRVVVIGTGGTLCAYSLTGSAWVAGAAGIAGAVQYLVYSPPNALSLGGDLFYVAGSGTGSIDSSPDAATVWTNAASGFAAVLGLAVLGPAGGANEGYVVALGNSGAEPRFSLAVNGGNTVWNGFQTPPAAATAEEPGSIAGAPQSPNSAVYHVMRCNGGARLRTAYATDGFTWVSGTTIEGTDYGISFTASPRLLICPTTGLFVIVANVASSVVAVFASRDFVSWSGPTIIDFSSTAAFAVAGGRVFCTRLNSFFCSLGVR